MKFKNILITCILLISNSAFAQLPGRYRVVYEYDTQQSELSKVRVEVWFRQGEVIKSRAFFYSKRLINREFSGVYDVQAVKELFADFKMSEDGTFNIYFKPAEFPLELTSLHLDSSLRIKSASSLWIDSCANSMKDYSLQRKGRTVYYGRISEGGL